MRSVSNAVNEASGFFFFCNDIRFSDPHPLELIGS